mgnify:CR=1 FL=1
MPHAVHAASALLHGGWADDVRIEIEGGAIARIDCGVMAEAGDERTGWLIPGMPNLHSHAFQRAIAGRGEVRGSGEDSFWSWRQAMYRFVERLDPEAMQAIAAMAYAEMLEGGFTRVGEFHYLHNAADGSRYADPAAMACALVGAAEETGLALTLLPVSIFMYRAQQGAADPTLVFLPILIATAVSALVALLTVAVVQRLVVGDTARGPVGWIEQNGSDPRVTLASVVPLGVLPARTAEFVAAINAPLVVTPWRSILICDLREEVADTALRVLAPLGLVFDEASPWLTVSACAGSPGCERSTTDVRADAVAAVNSGPTAPSGAHRHFVGCERGCGAPAGAQVLVASADGYRPRHT